jgi:hypothetical protein
MNRHRISLAPVLFLTAALSAQFAQAQHFDIFLARPAAGAKTVIGGADVDALAYDDTTRVFEAEMDEALGEFFTLEPGVNHPNSGDPGLTTYPAAAAPLVSGDTLRIFEREFAVGGFSDDLYYWNGVGAVSFVPAAADFRLDGADPLGSTAGAGGEFDDHPFLVVDSDSLPGVYLASVYGVVDGFAASDPVYLVLATHAMITPDFLGISQGEFDQLTDDDLDEALEGVLHEAVEFVETNVVPEPHSLLLALIGLMLVGARGRR